MMRITIMFSYFVNRNKRLNIKTVNNSFEYAARFKYFGTTLTNEQCENEESNNS